MDNPQEKKRIDIVEVRRGKKVGTDASHCGGSSRVRNAITISNSGYLLQFTGTGDVRFARLGGDPPVQVRLFGLTCTPKRPQKCSRGTSVGQVNCRKPSVDENLVDVAGGGVEVDADSVSTNAR